MEFFTGKTSVGFRHMHPLLAELVRTAPAVSDPESLSEAAEQRIYPEPTQAHGLDQVRADWKAFVEPGLQEHFRSSRDIVTADIRTMIEKQGEFELTIPPKHFDAWLNVLNQARLILAADLGFDEKLLASTEPPDLGSDLGLAVFRINLYAFMQQCLIEQME
jgi:hypothetical protein